MVQLLEEIDPLIKLTLVDMSYSRLQTYGDCPARYFYSYIERRERLFGPHAALGNCIHGVLENVDWTDTLDLLSMNKQLEIQRAIYDPEFKITDELMNVGHSLLADFVDTHKDDKFNVIGVEVPFAIVVGSALIVGYIDRIDLEDNIIKIVDYKSGRHEVSKKDIPSNLQLGIYALAAQKMYPDYPIYAELYYLRSGRRKGHHFTSEHLISIEDELIGEISKLINDRDFNITQNVRVCSYCDFKDHCPGGKRVKSSYYS